MTTCATEGNFVVGQTSKIVIYAGKTNEVTVRGLNSMTPPFGWSATFITIKEFGVPVDIQVSSGLAYDTVSCSGNFTLKDPTQAIMRQYSLNASKVTDMRFYLDSESFVALDLINNCGGYYQVGSVPAPSGEKGGVYSFSMDIAPSGQSTLFENHVAGVGLSFTADAGTGATVTDANDGFVDEGFVAGQIVLLDYVDGLDPLYGQIKTVTTSQLTLEVGIGDADLITTFAGIATSAIHSAAAMAFTA